MNLQIIFRLARRRIACAGGCQNNSLKEYQGIYEFIKDCTILSEIGNGPEKHRVTTRAVTEPKSMNLPFNTLLTLKQPLPKHHMPANANFVFSLKSKI